MRSLNKKQKKFLRIWVKKNWENLSIWSPADMMGAKNWETLEKMNDFKTIYQETNRFIVNVLLGGIL